jgi:hypothetical protein
MDFPSTFHKHAPYHQNSNIALRRGTPERLGNKKR